MKMTSAIREANCYISRKESKINVNSQRKIKPSKLNSDNLITSVSMASHKTSNTNTNLILKSKTKNPSGNSSKSINLITNPNEKEKSCISAYNKENNFSNNKNTYKVLNTDLDYFASNNEEKIKNNKNAKGKRNALSSKLINNNCRRDVKGIPILKGRKDHKITFKDHLDTNEKLTEVVKIESYKSYNAKEIDEKEQKKSATDDNTSCACTIF